jgi:hypothetical protein
MKGNFKKENSTPNRSSSKTPKVNKQPMIAAKGSSNSLVRVNSRVEAPHFAKNAMEVINKISFNSEEDKQLKRPLMKQMTGDPGMRMNTPQHRKNSFIKEGVGISNVDNYKNADLKFNNFLNKQSNVIINSSKNVINNSNYNDLSVQSAKTDKSLNINKHQKRKSPRFTLEESVRIIQFQFRKYLKKLKSDPKYEMSNLLKKKKMNILRNYGLNNVNNKNYIENVTADLSGLRRIEDDFNDAKETDISKRSTAGGKKLEEDKVLSTGNFGIKKSLASKDDAKNPIKEEKKIEEKMVNKGNDFIEEYESFLSYKKFDEKLEGDKGLEKLKKSLENYNKINDFNKESGLERDIDQSIQHKIDISDTCNVYEKIFKEIKKEEKVGKSKVEEEHVKEISHQESKNNIRKVDITKEDIKPERKQTQLTDVKSDGEKLSELSQLKYGNPKSSNSDNNSQQSQSSPLKDSKPDHINENKSLHLEQSQISNKSHAYSEEDKAKKQMVERITQMLETEDIKNSITKSLLSEVKDKEEVQLIPQREKSILGEKHVDLSYQKRNENISNMANMYKDISYENKLIKDETQNKINKIFNLLDKEGSSPIVEGNRSLYSNNNHQANITTSEILNMQLELKESKKTVEIMKEIIEELKKELQNKQTEHKKELESRVNNLKFEHENLQDRQTGLIEGLLQEKKKQAQIIDELNEKLQTIDKINHKKIQQMMENFDFEIKKNKDAWFQAEKIRRKKWEDQKAKEIKDMTVKGLEPEIERILTNHKAEVSKMEDRLNEDLRRQRDKLNSESERRISEIKERFIKEKEEALEHERSIATQRMRNQNERLEDEHQEERRRWNANLQAEISRLELLREKDKKIYEDQINKIEERAKQGMDEKEVYYINRIHELEKRAEEKVKNEGENFQIKFEKEKEKFVETKNKEFEAKYKEMKIELVKDRDSQMKLIIDRLAEETKNESKKMQAKCEEKADQINKQLRIDCENYRTQLAELGDKLQAESKVRAMYDENLDSITRKLQEKERELSKVSKQLLELNSNYNEISSKYSSVVKDFNMEKLDIELNYKAKLQKAESDNKLLHEKVETLKSYYESKINDIQNMHKEEIMEIEDRIKKTLQRKDEAFKKLQEDLIMKDTTITKYEELLNKQRKELLMKNN